MNNTPVIDKESIEHINAILQKVTKNITFPIAIRLIQSTLKEWFPHKESAELYDMLLFKTSASLAFQKSDVHQIVFIQKEDKLHIEVTINFLSIFGASSPLPAHYNERVLNDSYHDKVLLNFLTMLNHRLKKLIYPIWERQRYYVLYQKDLNDKFSKYILSFFGLYSQSQGIPTSLDLHKLLPFSGILGMHQKSTISFLHILRHYFNHEAIEIEEGIISKSKISPSQYFYLGKENVSLGKDTSIGSFILSRNLKFRIHFKQISWEMFKDFSLTSTKKKQLYDLVRLVQKTPLDYDIAITINKKELQLSRLGNSPLYIGTNIWLGSPNTDQPLILSAK